MSSTTDGSKFHTQTVARVIDFLAKFGRGEVKQTKRRGKKLVVIEPEMANGYHDRCERDIEQPSQRA